MVSLNSAALLSGNGIDVNSLVSQVMASQNGQLQIYSQQATDLQTQASALTTLNNDLANLSSAINSLSDVIGPLTAQSVASSQPSIVTASAQQSATPGNHTVVVSLLATQGTLYTEAVKDGDTSVLPANAQTADLKIQIGGANGPQRDIPISSGTNDTLNKIVSYINSQNWGVTAMVLSDASGRGLQFTARAQAPLEQ
jgi:flagellar hook-associated protein 2